MEKNLENKEDFIEDNPFYRSVGSSPSALWVLQNQGRVESKIRRTLASMGHKDYELDECYDHMIYYFIEHNHNEFNKDYFRNKEYLEKLEEIDNIKEYNELLEEIVKGKDEDDDYEMGYYILSRVEKETLSYVRVLNQLKEVLRYKDSGEEDTGKDRDNSSITLDRASYCEDNKRLKLEDRPDLVVEFEELQNILDYDLHIYDEDFQKKGLRNFSTLKFVQALFLMDYETDEERAEFIGVNDALYEQYKTGFTTLVKGKVNEGEDYYDLKMSISELIMGVQKGWKPIIR